MVQAQGETIRSAKPAAHRGKTDPHSIGYCEVTGLPRPLYHASAGDWDGGRTAEEAGGTQGKPDGRTRSRGGGSGGGGFQHEPAARKAAAPVSVLNALAMFYMINEPMCRLLTV